MLSFDLSPKSSVFTGADPREVSAYVNRAVGRHSIHVPDQIRPTARLLLGRMSEIGLCNISYGGPVEIATESLRDSYQLQVLVRGTSAWTGADRRHEFRPGEFLVINPVDPARVQYSSDCEKLIVTLPVEVVEAMAREEPECLFHGNLRFVRPVHALAAVDGLAGLLALMCDEAGNASCNSAIQHHYSQILIRKLLAQLETNALHLQTPVTNQAFERIKGYIRENLSEDLSLEMIAAASNVSLRKLYVLFKSNAQESPRDFIQRLRLERVRSDLLQPRASDSVTDIATRYGFSHLGRFSALYKARYNELPSQTLGRMR
ncbi:AraC family transcriptional regulator [Caballeronia novacaledonica]|uniref:AraC family transcriptional regulator n=1 Tax=Caballeronia novacaledonica TaxID=1544861 RepID=A0AA37ICT8_9BURK|nr:AraC family transcriptional regulator [Caballeronia novacaledonica]GJH27008.1 AraC family transcriptional regulator [Caballeronia novacaledonica]